MEGRLDTHAPELPADPRLRELDVLVRQIVEPITEQLSQVTVQLREADRKIGRLEAELEAALELIEASEMPASSPARRRWWHFW